MGFPAWLGFTSCLISVGAVSNPFEASGHKIVDGVVNMLRGSRLAPAVAGRKRNEEDEEAWKPVEQSADGSRNLCQHGKQVPDLYVLGVQKCATTSLATNLMQAGIGNVHGDQNPKEFHWFELRMNHTKSREGEIGLEANRQEWLTWMPDCPNGGKRQVLADFTPDYAKVVPHPEGTAMNGSWPPAHIHKADKETFSLPKVMRQMYETEGQASKLTLALMIREPLSQMQAAWYHAQSFNFENACLSCRAPSFKAALQEHLSGLTTSAIPTYTMWLWTMMYARQLEEWLRHFDASQFYVIPMNEFSQGDSSAICKDLSNRLGFAMDCGTKEAAVAHAWSHEHPPVDEDAGLELREEFDRLFNSEKDRLVKLLVKAHGEGMGLANYKGSSGDENAVRQWLEAGW